MSTPIRIVALFALSAMLMGGLACSKKKAPTKKDDTTIEDLLKKAEQTGGSADLVAQAVKMGSSIVANLDDEFGDDKTNRNRRLFAAKVLAALDSDNTVDALFKAASDSDPEVQAIAKAALHKRYRQPTSLSELIGKLKDKGVSYRIPVIELIGKVGNVTAVPILGDQMSYGNPKIRLAAVNALVKIHHQATIQLLQSATKDLVREVRAAALVGLAAFATKEMAPFFREYAERETDPLLKAQAVSLYTRYAIGLADKKTLLLVLYNDKKTYDNAIRLAALATLDRKHKDITTTGQLIRVMEADIKQFEGAISQQIATVLQARTKKTFGIDVTKWVDWYQTTTKKTDD